MTRRQRHTPLRRLALLGLLSSATALLPGWTAQSAETYRIVLRPDTLTLDGDVAVASQADPCTRRLAPALQPGAVVVGLDPRACAASSRGGRISARIRLDDVHRPTLIVVRVYLADRTASGGAPPAPATVALDYDTLLTLRLGSAGSAVVAPTTAFEPIVTTAVIRESRPYAVTVSVPAGAQLEVRRIELVAYPMPTLIKGIAYSPYRDCQYSGSASQPSLSEMRSDFVRVGHTANAVRTYSSRGVNAVAARIAAGAGLTLYPGVWLDGPVAGERIPDSAARWTADIAEIDSVIELVRAVPAAGIVVGNEYALRHRGAGDPYANKWQFHPEPYLAAKIRATRAALGTQRIPVGTAEIASVVFNFGPAGPRIRPEYREVLDQVDFLFIHMYPFWEGQSINGAVDSLAAGYRALARVLAEEYPSSPKKLFLGETGWPSTGIAEWARTDEARGTHQRSARYMAEFLAAADTAQIGFFYFSFADELWKYSEGIQGRAWGLMNSDRTAKLPVQSVMVPRAEFPSRVELPAVSWPSADAQCSGRGLCLYDEWPLGTNQIVVRDSAPNGRMFVDTLFTNPVFVPSGFMGNTGGIRISECARDDRAHGSMALHASAELNGRVQWAGVSWLAGGTWGGNGVDLTKLLRLGGGTRLALRFRARGEEGGERVQFGATDRRDEKAQTEWIELGREWREYEVPLRRLDLAHVVAGFWWSADRDHNRARATIRFLIDDVRYEIVR